MVERQAPIPVYESTYETVKKEKGDLTFDQLISLWAERYADES